MSHATTEAFHIVRQEDGPGMRRLLHAGIPMSSFQRDQRWLKLRGKPVWDPTRMYHPRGTPDEEFGITVDNREFAALALAGIKEHRSQRHVIYDPEGTDGQWMKMLCRETWVIAWPPREPGQPMLGDVFGGLE
jgi:hypothetical protein